MTETRYCAIALYPAGKGAPVWLHQDGHIVVFDTKANAQDVLENLAAGRQTRWDRIAERCYYEPLDPTPGAINRAVIVTDYDPYHLPAGHPVRSETHGKSWQRHLHWSQWLRGLMAPA